MNFPIEQAVLLVMRLGVAIVEAVVGGASKKEVIERAHSMLDKIEQTDADVDAAARGTHAEARRRET